MATYVIGDVQGCFEELTALIKKINFSTKDDTLIFTGDLVNRGKHSLDVLRYIKSLQEQSNCKVILGNHDLHLLAVFYQVRKIKEQDTFHDVLNAEDAAVLCEWLRQQAMIHFDESSQTLFVHAGIASMWTVSDALIYAHELENNLRHDQFLQRLSTLFGDYPNQWNESLSSADRLRFITNVLTRMRFCYEDCALDFKYKGKIGSQPATLKPWFEIRKQKQHDQIKIIFGHWAALEGETHEKQYLCVDTGCIWGNVLSALRLDDSVWFQVPSSTSAT